VTLAAPLSAGDQVAYTGYYATEVTDFYSKLDADARFLRYDDTQGLSGEQQGTALTNLGATTVGRAVFSAPDAGAARTAIGAQAAHTHLTSLSGLSGAANGVPYFIGSGAMATTPFTAFARTLLDDGDAATARATLGGTAIGQALFTSPTAGAAWAALGAAEVAAGTGYTKLPSGLIIQWGVITSLDAGGGAAFTFPIAFPNGRFVFMASFAGPWVAPPYKPTVYTSWDYSLTGGTVWCRDENGAVITAGNVHWIAIGN